MRASFAVQAVVRRSLVMNYNQEMPRGNVSMNRSHKETKSFHRMLVYIVYLFNIYDQKVGGRHAVCTAADVQRNFQAVLRGMGAMYFVSITWWLKLIAHNLQY